MGPAAVAGPPGFCCSCAALSYFPNAIATYAELQGMRPRLWRVGYVQFHQGIPSVRILTLDSFGSLLICACPFFLIPA